MKADWDKLGGVYANSEAVMIVDVDCTADGKGTCQTYGVKGYPTIQYFMAGSPKGKPYQQGRDYDSLAKFVKSTLEKVTPKCNALTGEHCLDIEKKFIDSNKDKSADELKEVLEAKKASKKAIRKEQQAAEKEHRKLLKQFKKRLKMSDMAIGIAKALHANAEDAELDEFAHEEL